MTVEDITQTRLAQRALADRAAGLGAMFDNAGAGIIEYDIASKRIVRVNRVYCAMMGRSEADLLAETDAARLTHPDDRGEHIARTAAIALTGHPYDSEKRYLRADGGVLWARISASITATHEDGRPRSPACNRAGHYRTPRHRSRLARERGNAAALARSRADRCLPARLQYRPAALRPRNADDARFRGR
ncbi:MAG: PAS domain-containing protein [Rhodospirillales bacterium]